MANNRYLYLIKKLHNFNIYNGTIVDCGCGEGNGSKLLLENGFNDVYSFDISDEAILKCGYIGIKANKGDITSLELKDNFADIFICSETLEHLSSKQSDMAVREIKRVCKKNGHICITVPEDKNKCLKGKGHKQYLSKQDLLNYFYPSKVIVEGSFCKKQGKCNLVLIFKNKKQNDRFK